MTQSQRGQNLHLAHGELNPRYDRKVQHGYAHFSDDGASSYTLPDVRHYHVTGSKKKGEDYEVREEVAE